MDENPIKKGIYVNISLFVIERDDRMATKKTQKKSSVKKKPVRNANMAECNSCGKMKKKTEFYISYNSNHDNGVLPYCKSCIKVMCNNNMDTIDKEKTLKFLRTIDRPFIDSLWQNSLKKGGDNIVGNYLRMINLHQYRTYKWMDGDLDLLDKRDAHINPKLTELKNTEPIKTEIEKFDEFEVTDEVIKLFGTGFTDEEYFHMWNKYKFLSANYTEQTSMHTEALATYIRYKVKEEMAVANNRANDAKTWGELAMKQAEKAKINPNQLSKADLQGGLTTIGEIAQAVEQNVDIIPILPRFRYRPNDAVDFCIWNYINYARDLEGKPLVDYEDVYAFYDKFKENYIAATGDPYGIFEEDPTLHNRDKVKQFIQLPDEYYDEGKEE